jgi:Asp-tRNA(Asn)/Glu-tRNA(Gln) amidotransferase A subunit family amidase
MPRLEPHLLAGLPLSVSMRRLDFDAGCPYHHALMAGTAQTSEPAPAPGEVDILFDLVRDRYGERLTAEQLEDFIESGKLAGLTAPEDRYTAYARDAILAKDYIKALRLRGVMAREADRVLSRLDALVGPGRATVAPALDQEFGSPIRDTAHDVMGAVGNGAGLPAIAVPNGFGDRGLPTSLQFMGRAYEENTILAAARAYQATTDWHRQHPGVA